MKYLNYYADKEYPELPETLKSNELKEEINEWDFSFIDPFTFEILFI